MWCFEITAFASFRIEISLEAHLGRVGMDVMRYAAVFGRGGVVIAAADILGDAVPSWCSSIGLQWYAWKLRTAGDVGARLR